MAEILLGAAFTHCLLRNCERPIAPILLIAGYALAGQDKALDHVAIPREPRQPYRQRCS